jgi:hypothetical protein
MAEDLQWLTEKHYLVCPKGAMFKQMKVDKSRTATFSGNLVANTMDTMKDNVFVCLGSMAFMAGAIAGLLVAALALMAVPVAGWAMAAIIGGALLLAIGLGYMKCKSNASSRKWISPSPNLIIDGHEGLVVKQSQLCCVAENVMIDIKETFWEAMMSTTMHDVGHIANFAFGFLAGRGMGSMAGTAMTSGLRAAGTEFLTVARSEMGNMFNPATLFGKMGWFCRAMRGFGMFGAYKGQYDIWTNPEMSTTDKLLASGQELVLAIFAAKGASLVCFPAGTQVHTSNGLVGIETIAVGTVVWTMNEASGQRELKPVTQVHRRTTLSMIVLELENGTIFQVTPEHRFLVNGEWREIQDISAAEELELIDGRKVTIKNIGLISKVSTVYNFDVTDNENYFVTEDGVLVHNGYNYNQDGSLKTRNQKLEGENHPVTDVPFDRKQIVVDGKNVEGVFPTFKSKFTLKLPDSKLQLADEKQFTYCTKQLAKRLEANPELAKNFTPKQLSDIKAGNSRIDGLTWDHNEQKGVMQLVDRDIHAKTGHTGGNSIWGGGIR